MACRYYNNDGFRCGSCVHMVKTNSVTVVGTVLVLNIPLQAGQLFSNHEKVCICVQQNIPTTITSAMTVAITLGTSATQYPLRTKCGNNVHADQIRSRKVYHTYVATDIPAFIVDGKELCCTGFNFPTIPAAAAPAE